jgi:hypothetical protein
LWEPAVKAGEERRRRTRGELEFRNATRQVEAEKAMTDHDRAQKAFQENRARLRAERLAREAAEIGLKAKGKAEGGAAGKGSDRDRAEGEGKMKSARGLKGRAWTAEDDERLKS